MPEFLPPIHREGVSKLSFTEILRGGKAQESELLDEVSDDDQDPEGKFDDVNLAICLTKAEKKEMRDSWKRTLVVKIWGRKVGYAYLQRRLQVIWHPRARFLFELEKDFSFALTGGPWMILDHYLIIRMWTHDFDPYGEKLEKIMVWVRLPYIPLEYFHRNFLLKIGRKIGDLKKIDQTTLSVSRGMFARICVEVDLSKPLLAKYRVRNVEKRIEYEGIFLICFSCGKQGHRKEECAQHNGDNQDDPNKESDRMDDGGNTELDKGLDLEVKHDNFGPWMHAPRRNRRGRGGNTTSRRNPGEGESGERSLEPVGVKGSRFSIMADQEDTLMVLIRKELTKHMVSNQEIGIH